MQFKYIKPDSVTKNKTVRLCRRCKKRVAKSYTLEYRDDWFRGNDEYMTVCESCAILIDNEAKILNDKNKEKQKRQEEFWVNFKKKLENQYTVVYIQ